MAVRVARVDRCGRGLSLRPVVGTSPKLVETGNLALRELGKFVQNLLEPEFALSLRKVLHWRMKSTAQIFPIGSSKSRDFAL